MNKIKLDDNRRLFLISDLHLMHSRIIGYTNRPFSSVQVMTETLINNWNDTVNDEDQIIFLGDFLLAVKDPIETSEQVFECLNGIKYFIIGNHDVGKISPKLPWYDGPIETEYRGYKLILQHYPYKDSEYKEGYKMFHGHCHGYNMTLDNINIINVSCEALNFKPILFEESIKGQKL